MKFIKASTTAPSSKSSSAAAPETAAAAAASAPETAAAASAAPSEVVVAAAATVEASASTTAIKASATSASERHALSGRATCVSSLARRARAEGHFRRAQTSSATVAVQCYQTRNWKGWFAGRARHYRTQRSQRLTE